MTPGTGDKTPGTSEDVRVARTRADVARAALEVLTDEGSDAVTHARVAELAGYSKTTLYTHWPSRVDLIVLAVDALGELPHHERSGNLRNDIIGELTAFRGGITEMRLDLILTGMAQWASVEEMREIRDKINNSGQSQMRAMLGEALRRRRTRGSPVDAHRCGGVPVHHVRRTAGRRRDRRGSRHRAAQRGASKIVEAVTRQSARPVHRHQPA